MNHRTAFDVAAERLGLDAPPARPQEIPEIHAPPVSGLALPHGVQRGLDAHVAPPSWRLSVFAGRLGEISGRHAGAGLTLVFRLVLEAQRQDEPVVWVSRKDSAFYPPDAADVGIDLAALAVVRVVEPRQAARAADYLVRSGAFGLIVMDFGTNDRLPIPMQSRLVGLAKKHETALLCLTEKSLDRPSIGSLVAVRAEAARIERLGDRYRCVAHILKDKRRGPGWTHSEVCRGPAGLR